MQMTDIAKEYGAALFILACEENAKHEYFEAIKTVRSSIEENPELELLLASPSIPLGDRLSTVERVFGDSVPEHVLSYLQLICEKGRMACLMDSFEEYEALLLNSERISTAKVTSASPLTDEQKEKLKANLEKTCNCKVETEYFIDESLLGGLIVETDGKIMDKSLRRQLREIKDVMNK